MVSELFVDAFCDFLEDHAELVLLVRDVLASVRLCLVESKEERVKSVGTALGLPTSANEQLATRYMNSLFQEFSLTVFAFTDLYYKRVCEKIQQTLLARLGPEGAQKLASWLSGSDLRRFLDALHKLYLHMVLSDPPVELKDPAGGMEYREFSKSQFQCLDGFPKDGAACAIVIPPPIRQGYVYQGIKAAVVIVKSPGSEIIRAIAEAKEKAKPKSVPAVVQSASKPEQKEEPAKVDAGKEKGKEEEEKKPAASAEQKPEQKSQPEPEKPKAAIEEKKPVAATVKTETDEDRTDERRPSVDQSVSSSRVKTEEAETTLQESVKPKTTRPVSIKYEGLRAKASWPSRRKCASSLRNHSMQMDEPPKVEEPVQARQAKVATCRELAAGAEQPGSARRNPAPVIARASTARAVHHPQVPADDLSRYSSSREQVEEPDVAVPTKSAAAAVQKQVNKTIIAAAEPPLEPNARAFNLYNSAAKTAKPHTPAKPQTRDESYETKARELRKKLIQMSKQYRVHTVLSGEQEQEREQKAKETAAAATPKTGKSYKTAKAGLREQLWPAGEERAVTAMALASDIDQEISKERRCRCRRLEEEKNRNMPLQQSKALTQQEKLMAYQRILKAKLSSIKSSAPAEQAPRPTHAAAAPKQTSDSDASAGNSYDTIKTSFHSKIQELNAKLFKYKKSIRTHESGEKKTQCQTFSNNRWEVENPLNESGANCRNAESREEEVDYPKRMTEAVKLTRSKAAAAGSHNKENNYGVREFAQSSNRVSAMSFKR